MPPGLLEQVDECLAEVREGQREGRGRYEYATQSGVSLTPLGKAGLTLLRLNPAATHRSSPGHPRGGGNQLNVPHLSKKRVRRIQWAGCRRV